jgi:hypothetical protein
MIGNLGAFFFNSKAIDYPYYLVADKTRPGHEFNFVTQVEELMANEAFMQAIKEYEASPLTAKHLETATLPNVCEIWKKVGPILKGILPFLKLIPVWGSTAASALQALCDLLDKVCPK